MTIRHTGKHAKLDSGHGAGAAGATTPTSGSPFVVSAQSTNSMGCGLTDAARQRPPMGVWTKGEWGCRASSVSQKFSLKKRMLGSRGYMPQSL